VQGVSEDIGAMDGRIRAGARVTDHAGPIVTLEALQRRGEMARRRLRDYADAAAIGLNTSPIHTNE
jgi:hypothetical protein